MAEGLAGLLEALTEWIDERFGRAAAWIVAALGIVTIVVIPLAICLYLLR